MKNLNETTDNPVVTLEEQLQGHFDSLLTLCRRFASYDVLRQELPPDESEALENFLVHNERGIREFITYFEMRNHQSTEDDIEEMKLRLTRERMQGKYSGLTSDLLRDLSEDGEEVE
ncbi:hypothetical protein COW46_02775 [Candidatus Gracilibacteria bacterium CG17_big_fil_post_rev_8_21_14_2_50_48_13]|nr:MAG: hypothetical protein COW46_02775 [Candidatus Gracilibacteria bacterium CG17_big_fil_post_rev_8_21_14_2_50_48_13]